MIKITLTKAAINFAQNRKSKDLLCKTIFAISQMIFICCLLQPLSNLCQAQKTLEFNQVIINNFTGSTTTFTVPVDKVWKIEQVAINDTTVINGNNASSSIAIWINGSIVYLRNYGFVGGSTGDSNPAILVNAFPIWFKQGTYSIKARRFFNGACTNKDGYISAIEFNVLP